MSGFINKEGEIIADPFKQSEMLREQYQSVYSKPDCRYKTGPHFFTGCQECLQEVVHECGEDVWNYPGADRRSQESCSHWSGVKSAELNCNQNSEELNCNTTTESEELNCNQNSEELNCNKTTESEELNGNQNSEELNYNKTSDTGCPDCRINTIVGLGPDDWVADYQFTAVDFSDALDKLSSSAAPGPDGIPALMLKKGKNTISHILYNIFKTCFDSGDIPDLLKRSYIIPIHKGGARPSQRIKEMYR